MQKGLVSIITPCYNTGGILFRLLDSILMQDYPQVEMYAIDDGSSDNTEEIIKSYIEKFEYRGYSLHYIRQENAGQSAALNNGLKLVKGEYLVWPDSDDYYSTNIALSKMVSVISEADSRVGIVRCLAEFVSEDTLNITRKYQKTLKTEWFEDCLFARDFWFPPGSYMIRMDAFDAINRSREIYVEKNAGQNWQMLLPILYTYKCLTINEYHYKILERTSSHSRGQYKSYEQKVAKYNSYLNTILFTLNKISVMPDSEWKYYKNEIVCKYKLNHLELAIKYRREVDVKKIKDELKECGYSVSKCWELGKRLCSCGMINILNGFFRKVRK